ncbi:MAG: glycosyltransferase N-terminal domain-containing protein, partial [Pseudomonadota bacterium]
MNKIRRRASLEAYRLAGQAALPLMRARYAQRVRDGFEKADQVQQHFGFPSQEREAGCWIWFHAGSADEVRSLLPLVRLCLAQDLRVIATSSSRYGLALWEAEERNQTALISQHAPADVERCVSRFLDHWKPDLAITVADEVLPVTTHCLAQRRVSCVVVGGVLSQRANDFWAVRPALSAQTFRQLELGAATDDAQAELFRDLGAPQVEVCGDLAFDAPIESRNSISERAFWAKSGLQVGRKTWLATPTNFEELTLCVETQRALSMAGSEIVCLLSPPPSMRASTVEAAVANAGLSVAQPPDESSAEVDSDAKNADQAWASSADVLLLPFGQAGAHAAARSDAIYLGGAFGGKQSGGLSPVPAIHHRLAIASGEAVQRHVGFFSRLHKQGAVRIIDSSDDLAAFLTIVLGDELAHRRM